MRTYLILFSFLLLTSCSKISPPNDYYVDGVKHPFIKLSGIWKFSMRPPANFWENKINPDRWNEIEVPGECQMQGYAIGFDKPYVYKKKLEIPADYKGKSIFLRFDGIYSYARVWVNGNLMRDHKGGFTIWICDITGAVQPGEKAMLTVEFTDRKSDISYGSGYAKHPIGGILRDVYLYAAPRNHLDQLSAQLKFDSLYENAELLLMVNGNLNEDAELEFRLKNAAGKKIELKNSRFNLLKSSPRSTFAVYVEKPLKWDAEHPNLYELETILLIKGKQQYSFSQKIGFREVKIRGNQLLVNGKPVRLRGACRHDVHPLLGRISNGRYEEQDVMLAKEANINFIRTSHYPPSEKFIECCDKYGIYLECESAVCFVDTHRSPDFFPCNSQNDSTHTAQYLSQIQEMANAFRNHPSVIIWSIGNESKYGSNFQLSYDWLKSNDPSRPVISSYPGYVPDTSNDYDIVSMHYPGTSGNLEQYGVVIKNFVYKPKPMLFDEWNHVPCYDNITLADDAGMREYWGQSLVRMWTGTYDGDGTIGGAIWGMIDETFMLPDTMHIPGVSAVTANQQKQPEIDKTHCVGYGEWGFIDVWRRKKPEFWSVKKAYSPIRLLVNCIDSFAQNREIVLPVYNRFDHTNLKEIKIQWRYGNSEGTLPATDLQPHNHGSITIPANDWKRGKNLQVIFLNSNNQVIDDYMLQLGRRITNPIPIETAEVKLSDRDSDFVVQAGKLYISFSKKTGLIINANIGAMPLINGGPFLTLKAITDKGDWSSKVISEYCINWKFNKMEKFIDHDTAKINIWGSFDSIPVHYILRIYGTGMLSTQYWAEHLPQNDIYILGIRYTLRDNFKSLSWDRNAYWTNYPPYEIGLPKAEFSLTGKYPKTWYRIKPDHPWSFDGWSYFYNGYTASLPAKLPYLLSSLKENIWTYELKGKAGRIRVDGNADLACRIVRDEKDLLQLTIANLWDYPNMNWGNLQKNIRLHDKYSNSVTLKLY